VILVNAAICLVLSVFVVATRMAGRAAGPSPLDR
jgi:hypothetical protein